MKVAFYQGKIGCTPDSVPMVFMVFVVFSYVGRATSNYPLILGPFWCIFHHVAPDCPELKSENKGKGFV